MRNDPGERVTALRRLSPHWAFFSVAVLGLLAFTLWLRYTAPAWPPAAAAPEPRPRSVAVLPFVNASPDSADEFFSDGMAAEVTAALGRVPGLHVAAPASAFALRRLGEDPQTAGRRLGVSTVLEGSVRHANDRLRVSVHLVSVSQGFDLWSDTYERPPDEIAAVQEEIGAHGARAMAYGLRPDLAIAVDVTHATDAPGVDPGELGDHGLGSGPVITRGAVVSRPLNDLIDAAAESVGIECTTEAAGSSTRTDADSIHLSRTGVATAVVSIPLRYMHSPVELVELADVEATIAVIAATALRLEADQTLARW